MKGSTIHRAHFLDELIKLVEPQRAHFGKRLERIEEPADPAEPVVLHFSDGTTVTADVVVGADGIHSGVRKHILGSNDPAARATFTGNVMYRGVVPMEVAKAKLGDIQQKAGVRCGKDATEKFARSFHLLVSTLMYPALSLPENPKAFPLRVVAVHIGGVDSPKH